MVHDVDAEDEPVSPSVTEPAFSVPVAVCAELKRP
jgi:hypothetical protein